MWVFKIEEEIQLNGYIYKLLNKLLDDLIDEVDKY